MIYVEISHDFVIAGGSGGETRGIGDCVGIEVDGCSGCEIVDFLCCNPDVMGIFAVTGLYCVTLYGLAGHHEEQASADGFGRDVFGDGDAEVESLGRCRCLRGEMKREGEAECQDVKTELRSHRP